MKLLAISGSLRAASTNTQLLRAAALLAPPTAIVVPGASLPVPLLGRGLDAAAIVADPLLADTVRSALHAIATAVPAAPPAFPIID